MIWDPTALAGVNALAHRRADGLYVMDPRIPDSALDPPTSADGAHHVLPPTAAAVASLPQDPPLAVPAPDALSVESDARWPTRSASLVSDDGAPPL